MDDHLDALSNIHRRRLLVALLDHDPQQDTIDVPEDVHEGEKSLETLRLEFYHSHLPRLEAAGFICWNQESYDLVKGPNFDEIRPLLESMREDGDERSDDLPSAQSTNPSRSGFTASGLGLQQSNGD